MKRILENILKWTWLPLTFIFLTVIILALGKIGMVVSLCVFMVFGLSAVGANLYEDWKRYRL